jgi:hypothetical protein
VHFGFTSFNYKYIFNISCVAIKHIK